MKVQEILKHFGVSYVERHSEVSKSCYGLSCPWCDDFKIHLGIFKDSGNFTCWKCGAKGSLFKLIQKLKGVSYSEYQKVTGQTFKDLSSPKDKLDSIFLKKENIKMEDKKIDFTGLIDILLTENLTHSISVQIHKFIKERHFSYHILGHHATCYYGASGYFSGRLVIPIIDYTLLGKQNIVGLIGRDLTNSAKKKYLFNPGFQASEYLYFAKKPKQNEIIVLVEGVFDAWAVYMITGINAAATFGSTISKQQIYNINALTNKIIYMPDSDVKESKIMRQKASLEGFSMVIVARCPEGFDPCSMNRIELENILTLANVCFKNCESYQENFNRMGKENEYS